MPKSDAPRPFRMRRVVYSDTNIVIPILAYRYPVFFMTRVAVADMIVEGMDFEGAAFA